MKRALLISFLFFILININGQDLKLWGSLDGFTLYTESSKSFTNSSILYSDGYNNIASIEKIKVYDGSNLVTDVSIAQELVKQLERKYLINYYLANNTDYIRHEWIFEKDIYEFYDSSISDQRFYLPSGSTGDVDPDFIDYVVNHAIKGTTTTGLNNYDRRVSVYKDLIFTSIIPESGDFDDFESDFDAEFGDMFNRITQTTLSGAGAMIDVKDATNYFLTGCINELDNAIVDMAATGFSPINKMEFLKKHVDKNLKIFQTYGYILDVANVGVDIWRNYMKVLLIKSNQDSDANLRLLAWQKIRDKYSTNLDPALVEAINKAEIEINEYFDSDAVLKMALENYFSDIDTYVSNGLIIAKEAATIYANHLGVAATAHITSSFAAFLGPALLVGTVAYETWKILNEGDRMFEAVVGSATIERNLMDCTPLSISAPEDYEYISVINNIRQLFAYFFYINLYDRLDQLGWYGEWISTTWKGTSEGEYSAYEDYLLAHKDIIVPHIQTFRPDFYPRSKSQYYALFEKISVESESYLTSGQHTPSTGTTSDNFTFSVNYKDESGASPQSIKLLIESEEHPITAFSGDISSGATYSVGISFKQTGTFNYHFEAITASGNELRYPENGELSVTIGKSCEGWSVSCSNIRDNQSSFDTNDDFQISVDVTNSSTIADYIYTNLNYRFDYLTENGNIIDYYEGEIDILNQNETITLRANFETPSSGGLTKVNFVIYPECDDSNLINNSASITIPIGDEFDQKQWVILNDYSYFVYSNMGQEISAYNQSFKLCYGNSSEISISYNNGSCEDIDKGDLEYFDNKQYIVFYEAYNSHSDEAYVSIGKQYADYITWQPTEIIGVQGEKTSFIANCSHQQLSTNDPDFTDDEIDSWFDDVDKQDDGYHYIFNIPPDAPVGEHKFYIRFDFKETSPYKEFVTQLVINVKAKQPTITSLSEYNLSGNDIITITGTNFGTSIGSVNFGGLMSTDIISWNNTQVKCRVPLGVQSSSLTINNGATSNAVSYNVISSTGNPELVQPIPDQVMGTEETMVVADLKNVFWDPNEQAFSFGITGTGGEVSYNATKLSAGELELTTTANFAEEVTITVTATDADGITIEDLFTLTPRYTFHADFSASPRAGTNPLTVSFINNSPEEATSWLWDFGDGTTSNEENPTHIYSENGDYSVSLTISNDDDSDTKTETNYIVVRDAVVADFTADKEIGLAPLTVQFTDNSTGNPTAWLWNFGDGTTSNEQNPQKTYTSTGNYNVSLMVENEVDSNEKTQDNFILVVDELLSLVTPAQNQTAGCENGAMEYQNWLDNQGGAIIADVACGNVQWSYTLDDFTPGFCGTGSYTVTFSASGDCGVTKSSTATFTIDDVTAPEFTLVPQNLTVECDGQGNTEALDTWLANVAASDDCCAGNVKITHNYSTLSDLCAETGAALVTWTATDSAGNTATTSATFTIEDSNGPIFTTAPEDTVVECNGTDYTEVINTWLEKVVAEDACGEAVELSNDYVGISSSCGGTGETFVVWTAEDECGNSTTASAKFTISDSSMPTFTIPEDITINMDVYNTFDADTSITGNIKDVADACSPVPEVSFNDDTIKTACGWVIERNWRIEDECGNIAESIQKIDIVDIIAPAVVCNSVNVVLGSNGRHNLNSAELNKIVRGSSDNYTNFDDLQINVSPSSFNCGQAGKSVPATVTITDACGNSATCQTTVKVLDNSAPVVNTIADVTMSLEPGICETKIHYPQITASDNCSVTKKLITGLGSNGTFPIGTTIEKWSVTDNSGNATTVSFKVTIETTNDLPTLDSIDDVDLVWGTDSVNVLLHGISSGNDCEKQSLTISATASSAELITSVSVNHEAESENGSLDLSIAEDGYGESDITVVVTDGEGAKTSQTFRISVSAPVPAIIQSLTNYEITDSAAFVIPLSSRVGEYFDDPSCDSLSITLTTIDSTPLPDWIQYLNDSIWLQPMAADSGCVDILVTATNDFNMSVSDTFEVCVKSIVVSISEIDEGKFEVRMYPNPSAGEVNIKFGQLSTGEIEIFVSNINGARIFQQTYLPADQLSIDLSDEVSGMYFVKIISDGREVVKKLVLKKN